MTNRARVVAEELLGTCKSLGEVATANELLDTDFCVELDDFVTECQCCGWWHSAEEDCDECS